MSHRPLTSLLLATLALAGLGLAGAEPGGAAAQEQGQGQGPTPERQQALVRIVRQDCGSCHGMRLTGGLGPALTREALAERPLEAIVATIVHGRPGTPMPPWRALLSEGEAEWIAAQLAAGFPEERPQARSVPGSPLPPDLRKASR